MEPWDEPDEGEKLRASARPPEPAERKACSRFRPHTLVPEKELLDLPEFTSYSLCSLPWRHAVRGCGSCSKDCLHAGDSHLEPAD